MTVRAGGDHARRTTQTVEVSRDGHVVAAADVTTSPEPHGTASVALSARRGETPVNARAELVDQVLDHPELADRDHVHVVLPIGDAESIARLQERTTGFDARAAGASSVVEADIVHPPADR